MGPESGGTIMSILDFGAHAPYVWSVYGIALVIFAANVLLPLIRHRRQRQILTIRKTPEENSS
ncbi:MAG: heme exporter protein CcmD [Pseudomonadota bacterium]